MHWMIAAQFQAWKDDDDDDNNNNNNIFLS